MHTEDFIAAATKVCLALDCEKIEQMAKELSGLRGRFFILGMGGSAANASHAVNDFRKLCDIESYAPTDNVAELTARANDSGLDTIFSDWLCISNLNHKDALLIFSVGGGDEEKKISVSIIRAIELAKKSGTKVYGIVGRADGYTAKHADITIVIPTIEEKWVTPLSEAFQAVVFHCLVSHPLLQKNSTKW